MDVTPRTLTEVPGPPGDRRPGGAGDGVPPSGAGPAPAAGRPGGRSRRLGRARGWILGLVAVAALGFVAFRGLGNATLFFYNADEAVAKRTELGDDRFRLQGNVVEDGVDRRNGEARFTVSYNGVDVPVVHRGEIPQLFQAGIPVVLEGRWDGDEYASDRMLIKHSEVYVEQNPERVADYDEGPLAVRS
ncbi:MAG: cytochrome c maturation protein CcmE [Acidimicrobiia bacterium]